MLWKGIILAHFSPILRQVHRKEWHSAACFNPIWYEKTLLEHSIWIKVQIAPVKILLLGSDSWKRLAHFVIRPTVSRRRWKSFTLEVPLQCPKVLLPKLFFLFLFHHFIDNQDWLLGITAASKKRKKKVFFWIFG